MKEILQHSAKSFASISRNLRNGCVKLYKTEDGLTKIDVTYEEDTVWLSKNQMAELFQRDRSVISKHIKNVFAENELPQEGNVQNLNVAYSNKPVDFYSLDVIISVGYRVKPKNHWIFWDFSY